MSYTYAPIILFVYKRLEHTKMVVEALKDNPESKDSTIYIYSDAPAFERDAADVAAVREYIHGINGFKDVFIVEREINWGIEKSEIDGVTTVIGERGKVIVVEDDIQVSNQFLRYMNYCLDEYKSNQEIYTITGYSFFKTCDNNDNLFGYTRSFSAWSWATWADRWQNMRRSLTKSDVRYIATHKSSCDNGQDFSYLLLHQFKNNCLTWDVAWYYTCCIHGGLTIFPFNSLVNNIGMDGSGVHYNKDSGLNRIEPINKRAQISYPLNIAPYVETTKKVVAEKRALDKKSLIKRLRMFVRFWLNFFEILASGAKSVEIL